MLSRAKKEVARSQIESRSEQADGRSWRSFGHATGPPCRLVGRQQAGDIVQAWQAIAGA